MSGSRRTVHAGQPSLFSADLAVPEISDLGGVLAAGGQLVRHPGDATARVSIMLADARRGTLLLTEFRARSVAAQLVPADDGRVLLRTDRTADLLGLASEWTKGAVKSVPVGLRPAAGFLRCWALAAGIADDAGFRLGLDPHAPDTHDRLLTVLAAGGLAGTYLGVRAGGPALRIAGHRRTSRLAELLGTPPAGCPPEFWPEAH